MRNLIRKVIKEVSNSGIRGSYNGPVHVGLKTWYRKEMEPFSEPIYNNTKSNLTNQIVDKKITDSDQGKVKKRIKLINRIKMEKKISPQSQNNEKISEAKTSSNKDSLEEDLGVWFGTKKKPKGSKQPAGPWVNICRKKEGGGHPPCGRPEADSKSYPKCRAKGVAANMSDAQKKSACSQKRKAEKSNPKVGTGNKPTMVSNKKKSRNESLRDLISKILKESFR